MEVVPERLSKRVVVMAVLVSCVFLAGCSFGGRDPDAARVLAEVDRPPDGRAAELVVSVFPAGSTVAETEVTIDLGSTFEVDLPEGTWDFRTADRELCFEGFTAHGGATQRIDLVWPTATCISSEGPPPPTR